MKSTFPSSNREPRGARMLRASLPAVAVAALATTFSACSSSGSGAHDPRLQGTGAVDGSGVGGGNGAGGFFTGFTDAGFVVDAQPPVISDANTCGETSLVAKAKEVSILLVIDESGSMTDTPTGFTTDKWTALKSAVNTTLAAVQNDIAFGLELFPYPIDPKTPIPIDCSDNCCEMPAAPGINIPIEKGSTAVPKIRTALGATAPAGGTPTALALSRALDYFKTGAGKSLTGDKYVLLATDGGPNCNAQATCDATTCTQNLDGNCPLASNGNCCGLGGTSNTLCLDADATKTQIQALAAAGVKTFVVGIPGAEKYATSLDAFATAGGEENPNQPPKYFAVDPAGGTQGLATVLSGITKKLVTTCDLALDTAAPDPNKVNVRVDGVLVPYGAPDGWEIDATVRPEMIHLLGATCTKVQTEGAQSVQVILGCKPRAR